jgi:hypothetical protein
MCSNPLDQPDDADFESLGGDSNTTVVFKNLRTQQGTASLMECLICPECQTINHLGWLFCPQCGKQVDASFLQTLERVDQAPTMVANLAPLQNPLQTVVAHEWSPDAQRPTETPADAPSFMQPSTQKAPDTKPEHPVERPSRPQLDATSDPASKRPTEQPSVSTNSSNGTPDREASPPQPVFQPSGVACAECGADNDSDYSYCLNCGASLPVLKTIVMASIAHPVKPLLRLLVQGGGLGPTYEIRNDARIGRTEGSITFPHDSLMSTNHARVYKNGADFILIDEASSNGTFIRVKKETKLEPGDVILVGGQLFRFEA